VTVSAPTLASELASAQAKAQDLHTKLSHADAALREALDGSDYARAQVLKAEVDALRHTHLIADAHVQALQAGVEALRAVREAEERDAAERARQQQAHELYEAALGRENAALEEQNRLLADVGPAYEALRQIMREAIAAGDVAAQARRDGYHAGVTAGHIDAAAPAPHDANEARTRFEYSRMLLEILRTPELYA
jgi:hypothetical protein